MAASVLLYHVVGDLTLGKPELVEFHDTETVESATRAIAGCSEGAVTVWRRGHPQLQQVLPKESSRAGRFVGMLDSLDLVAFVGRVGDQEKAMRTPVSEVVVPNGGLLKEVDPGTRLIDALEMMKQGVRCLLVRKSIPWKGMSKRFSVIYNGKWLKHLEAHIEATSNIPSSSTFCDHNKFCCLSREDVIRFLIGCLGALAPIPLSSISILGAITLDYSFIDASSPAIDAAQKPCRDPCAVAVVETNMDGSRRIIGEISSYQLWKCDHSAAGWTMANLSAGQFVMGADDNNRSLKSPWAEYSRAQASSRSQHDFSLTSKPEDTPTTISPRPRKFSSRNVGFLSKPANIMTAGGLRRSLYRGRSAPLTCKNTTSLAAVMAQMLSHRATHVWVTEADSDDMLVGIVGYTDILHQVTRNPSGIAATL